MLKVALFKDNASIVGTYGAATTNYTDMTGNSDEASGVGYTVTGATLTNVTPVASGTTAITEFADVTWTTATIIARGALIYNTTAAGAAIGVIDFGVDKTSSGGDFSILWPTFDSTNAIIRIA